MCDHGETVPVEVKIQADLACDGIEKMKIQQIYKCIAPLVKALQEGGIDMRSSCCGHGKRDGHITLADGCILIILQDADSARRRCEAGGNDGHS